MSHLCSLCGSTFAKSYNLKRHLRNIHKSQPPERHLEKIHRCLFCTLAYTTKKNRDRHARVAHPQFLDHYSLKYIKPGATEDVQDPKHVMQEQLPSLDIFPYETEYVSMKYSKGNDDDFCFQVSFEIKEKNDSLVWFHEFKVLNKVEYRSDWTNTSSQSYMHKFVCHFNAQKKSEKNKKNLDCPASLSLTIKNSEPLFCHVMIQHTHNHRNDTASALKFLHPSDDTVNKFKLMFQAGYSPGKAIKQHEEDLQEEFGEDVYEALADRSLCPDNAWVYNFYYRTFKMTYGEAQGPEMLDSLRSAVEDLNNNLNGQFAAIKCEEDMSFCIAMSLPIMKRALNTSLAGDICFVDSSGGLDRFGCRVFLIMCTSPVGGLPLGVLITTSESEAAITSGLELFSSLLSESSFGGRGAAGPRLFMTDCSDAERNALGNIFPESIVLLCIFHVLQAIWRWLMNGSNHIKQEHRPELFSYVKRIMYAKTKDDVENNFALLSDCKFAEQYPNFMKYFENWYEKREDWVLCLRTDVYLRNQNTNNIVEAAMRVLKDKIFDRTRAFSPVQLFDFLVKDFAAFYERKLLKTASGRPENYLKKKFKYEMNDYDIQKLNDNIFQVKNLKNNNSYTINVDVNVCSCPSGELGGICKHFDMLYKKYNIRHQLALPTTKEEKEYLHFIATGNKNFKHRFYEPLSTVDNIFADNQVLVKDSKVNNDHEVIIDNEIPVNNDKVNNDNEVIIDNEIPVNDDKVNDYRVMKTTSDEDKMLSDFKSTLDEMYKKVQENKDVYLSGVASFNKHWKKINTEASLVSALHWFGKFTGYSGRKRNAGQSRIAVQSTAISRRKTPFGGRKAFSSGRPPKASFTNEHGYGIQNNNSSPFPKRKRTRPAPHDLSHCVGNNVALGKSH